MSITISISSLSRSQHSVLSYQIPTPHSHKMPAETPASCLLFVRVAQLTIANKDINDFIDRLQSLSLEYKQTTQGRAIEDDALKAILVNQAMTVPEYREVVKALTESGQLTDYYTLATALQKKEKEVRSK